MVHNLFQKWRSASHRPGDSIEGRAHIVGIRGHRGWSYSEEEIALAPSPGASDPVARIFGRGLTHPGLPPAGRPSSGAGAGGGRGSCYGSRSCLFG